MSAASCASSKPAPKPIEMGTPSVGAVACSQGKSCGICFEVILEKDPANERRFGILPNCNHCYCLSCIRKWRQVRQFKNKIIRACPECRVTSDYVCPSTFWVDTKEDKDKLILDYKNALSKKDCKHFNKGKGKCPFGNRCFYRHALSNGRILDVGPPPQPSRRRQRRTAAANRRQRHNSGGSGDFDSIIDLHMVEHMILQEISEYFEFRWGWMTDLMSDLSDDDDDDDDDDEFFDLTDLDMF